MLRRRCGYHEEIPPESPRQAVPDQKENVLDYFEDEGARLNVEGNLYERERRERRSPADFFVLSLSLSPSLSLDWERYDRIYTIELYLVSSSHVII